MAALAALLGGKGKWDEPLSFIAHDKWSLGCVFTEMICYKNPFQRPGFCNGSDADTWAVMDYTDERHYEWVSFLFSTFLAVLLYLTLAVLT